MRELDDSLNILRRKSGVLRTEGAGVLWLTCPIRSKKNCVEYFLVIGFILISILFAFLLHISFLEASITRPVWHKTTYGWGLRPTLRDFFLEVFRPGELVVEQLKDFWREIRGARMSPLESLLTIFLTVLQKGAVKIAH